MMSIIETNQEKGEGSLHHIIHPSSLFHVEQNSSENRSTQKTHKSDKAKKIPGAFFCPGDSLHSAALIQAALCIP